MRRIWGIGLILVGFAGCGGGEFSVLPTGAEALLFNEDGSEIASRIGDAFESLPSGTKVRVVEDKSRGRTFGMVSVLILEGRLKDRAASFPRQDLRKVD